MDLRGVVKYLLIASHESGIIKVTSNPTKWDYLQDRLYKVFLVFLLLFILF